MKSPAPYFPFWKSVTPYFAAFLAAFLVQIAPPMSEGKWPDSRQVAGALISGFLATHLLDRMSPRQRSS